jgi:hypothetical protein
MAARRPWNELMAWINAEELTKPATLAPSVVDPFRRPEPVDQEVSEAGEATRQPESRDVDPRQLGLELNSTVIGPTSRLASINGHICPLESEILVTPTGLTVRAPGAGSEKRPDFVEDRGHSRGQTQASHEHDSPGAGIIGFILTEIQPTHVTLSRGTRSYRIDLKQFESAGRNRRGATREVHRDG